MGYLLEGHFAVLDEAVEVILECVVALFGARLLLRYKLAVLPPEVLAVPVDIFRCVGVAFVGTQVDG